MRRQQFYIKHDEAPASDADIEFVALARDVLPWLLDALVHGNQDAVTDEELDEIELVVAHASAGPWTTFLESRQPIGGSSVIWVGDEAHAADMYVWLEDEIAPDGDIEFIAAAREDIPDLLTEIRFHRRRIQRLTAS